MKVLFLAHSYPRFGTDPIGSFILRLAMALRGRGIDVSVLAPAAAGVPAHEVLEGVPVERFRYAPRRWETLAYTGAMRQQVRGSWVARAAMTSFLAVEFARALAARRRFAWDLVHAHWWFPAGLVGSWLKRWTGTRWEELDGSATGRGASGSETVSYWPDLRVDASGRPVLLWLERIAESLAHVYVRRWSGSRWQELGASARGDGALPAGAKASAARLALDPEGRPLVCWQGVTGEPAEILLTRFEPAR